MDWFQEEKTSKEEDKLNKIYEAKTQAHLGTHPANRSRWLQNSWHTPFDSRTAGYKSPKQGQEVDRKVREPPSQWLFPSGLEPDTQKINKFSEHRRIDRRHEQHRDLLALRKLFQKAMPWVEYLLGNRYCLLQLWKKFKIFAETKLVRKDQLRRLLIPWLCHKEE